MKLVFFTCLFLAILVNGMAQPWQYTPRKTYGPESKHFFKAIEEQMDDDLAKHVSGFSPEMHAFNRARKSLVGQYWKSKLVIDDDSLETFVASVIRRIVKKNGLAPSLRHVLIIRDPEVNARSLGSGVFIVNVGLLARVHSEGQLAFTLAHEMAHDELNHVLKGAKWQVENSINKKVENKARAIATQSNEGEDLRELLDLLYAKSERRRKAEYEADSVALTYLQNAGYNDISSLQVLEILEKRGESKYPVDVEFLLPLHHEQYPLQDEWFAGRNYSLTLDSIRHPLIAFDSLLTHPEIEKRKARLKPFLQFNEGISSPAHDAMAKAMIRVSEFEAISSAYEFRYDTKVLHDCLALLTRYPKNSYLISRVGAVLIRLYEWKNGSHINYGGSYPHKMTEHMQLLSSFIANIRLQELGNVTYYFFKNERNFNPADKSHLYLLWRICDLTYRHEERKKIEHDFRLAFGTNVDDFKFR
jgi:Zn-dependent protease with chaperone function